MKTEQFTELEPFQKALLEALWDIAKALKALKEDN